MSRAALALVLIASIGGSSCSWLFGVRAPPPRPWPPPGVPREEPCATSMGRPMGDVVYAAIFGSLALIGVGAAMNADRGGGDEDCRLDTVPEVPTTFALVTGGFAVLYGLSAGYGFRNAGACRDYKAGAR